MARFEDLVQGLDIETGLDPITRYDRIFVLGFLWIMVPNVWSGFVIGLLILGVFLAWGSVSSRTRSKPPTAPR